jgi:riboflavin biosynthesis pyrimidine reductase
VRQLLPDSRDDVDILDAFAWEPTRETGVRVGMVMSVDGSASDEDGWTSGLGGSVDKQVVQVLRAHSDGILVGAGSIRTAKYPPHRLRGTFLSYRTAAGAPRPSPLVVVTGTLRLNWSLPVFTRAAAPTIVLTSAAALALAEGSMRFAGDVLVAGAERVDLRLGLELLRQRYGMKKLLCEGGPRLAAAMFDRGLVEELCLSLAPVLLPGSLRGIVQGLSQRHSLVVRAAYEDGGEIFVRYGVNAAPR